MLSSNYYSYTLHENNVQQLIWISLELTTWQWIQQAAQFVGLVFDEAIGYSDRKPIVRGALFLRPAILAWRRTWAAEENYWDTRISKKKLMLQMDWGMLV